MPLPEKDDFYSNLNIEDITDSDYNHPKRARNVNVMIFILKVIHYF